jgi:acylphosphatase
MKRGDGGGERRWVRWRVAGSVQGVGFRWFVQQAAMRHGVDGDVCNLPDGRVEVRARGNDERLKALLADVRSGPRHARVDHVETLEPEPVAGADGFGVRW